MEAEERTRHLVCNTCSSRGEGLEQRGQLRVGHIEEGVECIDKPGGSRPSEVPPEIQTAQGRTVRRLRREMLFRKVVVSVYG